MGQLRERGSVHLEDIAGVQVNLDDPRDTLAHVFFAVRYGHGCLRGVAHQFAVRHAARREFMIGTGIAR